MCNRDGVCGDVDNCVDVENDDQADSDADGKGDACDVCPNDAPEVRLLHLRDGGLDPLVSERH